MPTRDEIVTFLLEQIVQRLGCDAHQIDPDADLVGLGIGSLDAVLVSGELEDKYQVEIEPVLLFECRTVNRVADSVVQTLLAR